MSNVIQLEIKAYTNCDKVMIKCVVMERIEIFFVYIRLNLIIVMVDGQRQNNTLLKHKSTRVHTAKHKEKVKELGTLPIDYSLLLL